MPDRSIADAAATIPLGRIVLHTSGATEVDVLRPHRPAGSLHPLMTFPGVGVALPDLQGVPAAIAGDPEALEAGRELAMAIGLTPLEVPGDRRLYHCAAVMAGNFATVLLAEAATVLESAGVPYDVALRTLAPLASRSLLNATNDPARSLTGPFARGDEEVISGHRTALHDHDLSSLAEVYEILAARTRRLVTSKGE